MRTLSQLFEHELKDVYDAEQQNLEALQQMIDHAVSDELKQALREHHKETEDQVERLQDVAQQLEIDPDGETCKAMQGIVREARSMIQDSEGDAIDAAIIMAAQKDEHYEIASYGALCSIGKQLGLPSDCLEQLHTTLEEEKHADQKLSQLAKQSVNPQAQA